MSLFEHQQHPHVEARKQSGPPKVADQHSTGNRAQRANARLATWITRVVGTMWMFYAFNLLASASAKTAFSSGSMTVIINWISSNWLQLILLPALMVGQNIQGKAADARAESTYADAEAILDGLKQQAQHLAAQDTAIISIQQHLEAQDTALAAALSHLPVPPAAP
jgi:hypothetical protein